jgi:GntR family transcriptional repressor for pyruvate dehydrogenase complex
VAAAAGNRIVASLVEMVSALFYDERRKTAQRATDNNLQSSAEMHRRIYKAIRSRKPDRASSSMNEHLVSASAFLAAEEDGHRGDATNADNPGVTTRPDTDHEG